ncbi:MAG: hypothetical protein JXA13_14405 [Anaerolineales bacterium]|nr:hypothetical protein [Anaerolineales bacterium]
MVEITKGTIELTWLLFGVMTIIVLFVGYGIGYVEFKAKFSNKNEQLETDLQDAQQDLEKTKARLAKVEAQLEEGVNALKNNLMRLWLDETQTLNLELDGNILKKDAVTPDQKKRLIAALNQVRPWVDSNAPAQPPVSSAVTPRHPKPAVQTPALKPAAISPTSGLESVVPAKGSMVDQIDAILQQQIAGTPLHDRGIKLSDAPGGGVIVYVGINRYQGVDTVPDPEIQEAIRMAISVWESTSGL